LDFLKCVAEPARFQRSTGRIGFRIEEQDQIFSAKVLQGDGLAIFVGQGEVRSFIINFHRIWVLTTAMNLYRRRSREASLVLPFVLGLLVVAGIGFTAAAQRRKPHKLRATALVELTTSPAGKTVARLVPITILDEGSFHDASIYKSTPQPMALDGGVVYEAQKTGQALGYFTVDGARKDRNGYWAATGRWQVANTTPKAQTPVAAPTSPVDERPILRRPDASSEVPPSNSPTPSQSGSGAPPSPEPSSSNPSSDDRPVLHRTPSESTVPNTPPPSTPSPAPSPSPASLPPDAAESTEDPNRPTLRHRTPQSVHEANARPTPAPAAAQPAASPATTPKPSAAVPAGVAAGDQTLVAVSDSQGTEPRSYEVIWKAGEREAVESKMRHLALAQFSGNNAGSSVSEGTLGKVVIRGFDLDLSNEAVMVLNAEVPPGTGLPSKAPVKSGTKAAAGAAGGVPVPTSRATRYITLIARLDMDGNPQKLAASVTDSSRLDVAPRLELIDAVDVDGDGLGELLFRQYSFDEESFVIYSIGRSTVTKLFEGASQALKPDVVK
jgi:hypothetical protein